MDDEGIVAQQLGRRPRSFRRVAVRCAYGFPAVTEQAPYDADGKPFPTTYYLTCPWLVAGVSRVEAAGGVKRLAEVVEAEPELGRSLAAADAEQRRVRPELDLGIGGTRSATALKCLHAHAAFALARPGYTLGERILAELDPLWPDCCCTAPA